MEKLCHPLWNPSVINLGVTRAIGDLYFKLGKYTDGKPTGLIATPSIKETIVSKGDEFLLLATDGLWEVFSHQEAVSFVAEKLNELTDPSIVSEKLVEAALAKGSKDNVTVTVVAF